MDPLPVWSAFAQFHGGFRAFRVVIGRRAQNTFERKQFLKAIIVA
jgi:hypothetical protein